MLYSFFIAAGGIIGIMLLWVLVQRLWGKTFADFVADEDVMSGRTKCSNCGCTTACKNKE